MDQATYVLPCSLGFVAENANMILRKFHIAVIFIFHCGFIISVSLCIAIYEVT